jgi:hypothetical protein
MKFICIAILLFTNIAGVSNSSASESGSQKMIWTPICVGDLAFKYKEAKYRFDLMGYYSTGEIIQQFDERRMPLTCSKDDDINEKIAALRLNKICIENMYYLQVTQSTGKSSHTTNYPYFIKCD